MTVASWLASERAEYADRKYRRDGDEWHEWMLDLGVNDLSADGKWTQELNLFGERASQCGLNTPAGMQAFGKMIVTALSCFEAAVMLHGKPPMPGVKTGTIEPWRNNDAHG